MVEENGVVKAFYTYAYDAPSHQIKKLRDKDTDDEGTKKKKLEERLFLTSMRARHFYRIMAYGRHLQGSVFLVPPKNKGKLLEIIKEVSEAYAAKGYEFKGSLIQFDESETSDLRAKIRLQLIDELNAFSKYVDVVTAGKDEIHGRTLTALEKKERKVTEIVESFGLFEDLNAILAEIRSKISSLDNSVGNAEFLVNVAEAGDAVGKE